MFPNDHECIPPHTTGANIRPKYDAVIVTPLALPMTSMTTELLSRTLRDKYPVKTHVRTRKMVVMRPTHIKCFLPLINAKAGTSGMKIAWTTLLMMKNF